MAMHFMLDSAFYDKWQSKQFHAKGLLHVNEFEPSAGWIYVLIHSYFLNALQCC